MLGKIKQFLKFGKGKVALMVGVLILGLFTGANTGFLSYPANSKYGELFLVISLFIIVLPMSYFSLFLGWLGNLFGISYLSSSLKTATTIMMLFLTVVIVLFWNYLIACFLFWLFGLIRQIFVHKH